MLILDKLDQKHFDEGLTMSLNPEFAKFAAATSEKKKGGLVQVQKPTICLEY